jgi:hypothetical protein
MQSIFAALVLTLLSLNIDMIYWLQSFAKDVQRVSFGTLSSEFLLIPVGSSKALELEICITCIYSMVPPISFSFISLFFLPINVLLFSFKF